jgi:UDP-N-acetyl-D-glucosamine dehydrogenase
MRESPALDVMHLLEAKGAQVDYADPYVAEVHGREWPGRRDLVAVELKRGTYKHYDCVVIITDHKAFDYQAMVEEADLIVDTRNAIKQRHLHVFRLGAARPDAATERVGVV